MKEQLSRDEMLAIEGGSPVLTGALPSWPHYADDEVRSVTAVLRSGRVNFWTGTEGRAFETEYAAYLGRRHAIALANGTVALELPLRAWGIGPGDDVVVTPRSFIASVACVVNVGARPVFADVDADSGNISPESIRPVLTSRTRALICVHLAGWPCDMNGIMKLAREHGIKVLEDCAQAHGATYQGRPVGSSGDAAAFSFCQDKIITTGGEGGLLAMDDTGAWKTAWSLKDHGTDWDAMRSNNHGPGFRWVHHRFGTNYRLTEPQSAIGRLQLAKLEDWNRIRTAHAQIYAERLADLPGIRMPLPPHDLHDLRHAWYRFSLFVRPERLKEGWTRDRVLEAICAEGAPCFAGSCSEIYLEKAFDGLDCRPARSLPIARELGETSLVLLTHPTLEPHHVERIAGAVRKVLNTVTR